MDRANSYARLTEHTITYNCGHDIPAPIRKSKLNDFHPLTLV